MDKNLEQEYLSILESIQKTESEISKHSRKKQRLHGKMNVIRSGYIVEIGSNKDEKQKLKFSNERMREAELTLRLHKDSEYVDLKEQSFVLDDEYSELVSEQNKLVDIKLMLMIKMGLPVAGQFVASEMEGIH